MSSGNQGIAPERYEGLYDAILPEKLAGSMEGKTVLITGAGRGIGRAISLAFAQSGADVALVARTKSHLESLATQIRSQYNRRVLIFAIDVTDSSALASCVATVEKEWGRIDVLIPNAGVNTFRPFVHSPFNEWWRIMEVNLKGALELASLVLKGMKKKNEGAIVFVSSRAATVSLPGMTAYSASKTALTRFVTCLQAELDAEGLTGIHTYSIHPGAVDTDLTPGAVHPDIELMAPGFTKRMEIVVKDSIHPPELSAWTCVYLATGKARALRGLYLDVDQNIETIISQADTVRREDMYDLVVKFLGGLDNLGGKAGSSWVSLSSESSNGQKVETKL